MGSNGSIATSKTCSDGSNGHLKMVIMVVIESNTTEHNGSNESKVIMF